MLKRKVMAVLMVIILTFTIAPTVLAAEDGTKISKEKAIEIATQIFPELKDKKYGVNLMDYWEPNGGKVWNINFPFQESPPSGNANIMIDADTGSIRRFEKWEDYRILDKYFAPKFTKEELKVKAEAMIKKLQPAEFKEVEFKEEPGYQRYYGEGLRQPILHYFWYTRKVGNIPYSKDGFRVTLNATTGEITTYEFMWSKSNLPNSENTMPIEKAKLDFVKNIPMKLMYIRPWIGGNRIENRPLRLVYNLPGTYFGGDINAIDAKTGKPLNWGGKESQVIYEQLGDGSQSIVNKTEKLTKLLTEDESRAIAQKEVEKYVNLSEYKISRSDYLEDYYGMQQKVYIFAWSKSDTKAQVVYTYTITINSETGAIEELSYDKNDPNQYRESQTPPKLTWEEGKDKAKSFVVEKFPQFKNQLAFIGSKPYYPEERGGYFSPIHYYTFSRIVNGAVYPENGVYIQVNSKTGEIVNYRYRWEYVDFPEVKNIISQKQAEDTFMNEIGIQFNYRSRYDMPMPNAEGLLVYEVKQSSAAYIDALTGKIKTYDGKDFNLNSSKLDINKIVKGQREAVLLNDMGVLVVDESYKPEGEMSKGEFVKILISLKGYSQNYYVSAYKENSTSINEQYIVSANKLGWIDNVESFKPQEKITRQEMASILSKFMSYEEIVKSKIIKVAFEDSKEFTGNNGEAAAIIKALNLINISDNKFEPNKSVTNEEAVRAIYHSIEKLR